MSDAIDRAMLHCMFTQREDWRIVNGAAVHKDATVGDDVVLGGDAIIRRGTIRGGTIEGGTIEGGTIRGGTIWGGTIRGGTIEGGTIEGGTIRGGTIWGGTIEGGTIEGGTIRGGTIWGGTIRGGTIEGGTIEGGTIEGGTIRGGTIRGGTIRGGTPFVLIGYLPWTACVSGPSQLSIGCQSHSFEHWRANVEFIAAAHEVDAETLAKVRQVIDMAEAAHAANPILAEEAAPATASA